MSDVLKEAGARAHSRGEACTVFEKPRCSQCTLTKRWLEKHGVPYSVEDLDPAILEAAKDAGITSAPLVVTSGGEYWGGFRPDLLNALK